MRWICPTCGRAVGLWYTECPHCAPAPAESSLSEEPVSVMQETFAAETKSQPRSNPTEDAFHPQAALPASAPAGKLSIPRAAYLAMALLLALLGMLLWPSNGVRLQVDSEPGGALAHLDGERVGETPLELSGLERGHRYTIRLEHEGYYPFEQTFLAHAQETPWTITLKRNPDPLLDQKVVRELVEQIHESSRESLFSHELAEALFTVNPLIEQNPWLTEHAWSQIFQQVVETNFDGDSQEFLRHLRTYKAELARGQTSKQAWYQHLHKCEKVCRPVVTEVFKRHIEWLRRTGFTVVYFPFNEHRLGAGYSAAIRQFIAERKLAEDHSRQVLLVGRASRIGGRRYNLELSRKRVEAVVRELAVQLPDGRTRLRLVHLGFEPPQISPSVADFLHLEPSLSDAERNQSVMLIVSEPLPRTRPPT